MAQNAAPQFSNRRKSLGHAQARDPDPLPHLDGEMSADTIAWRLARIRIRRDKYATLQIDREVRDYLVDLIKRRHRTTSRPDPLRNRYNTIRGELKNCMPTPLAANHDFYGLRSGGEGWCPTITNASPDFLAS